MKNKNLNPKQRKFAQVYVSRDFFGNGLQSYVEAYNVDKTKKNWRNTAKTGASRLLTNDNLLGYINDLLESQGLNKEFADKQLLFLITQNADLKIKLGAIKEFNAMKGRIIKKLNHSGKIDLKQITGMRIIDTHPEEKQG